MYTKLKKKIFDVILVSLTNFHCLTGFCIEPTHLDYKVDVTVIGDMNRMNKFPLSSMFEIFIRNQYTIETRLP